MSVRVAINGFGRIGRNVFRAARERGSGFEIVAVNDITDAPTLAHLLKYDSVHGALPRDVSSRRRRPGRGRQARAPSWPSATPPRCPGATSASRSWSSRPASSPSAKARPSTSTAGARKVIISAPATDPDITICIGVNDDHYDADSHHIISNASCTTNCLAPLVKVLLDTLRHRARLHDHDPRLHQRPAAAGRCRTRTCAAPAPPRST